MTINEMEKKFCKKVFGMCIQKGISLATLAQRSGVPLEMLEALERGVLPEDMMVDDAFNLARVFGCETYELFE